MKTQLLPYNKKNVAVAAEVIKNGGIVAFPTETVYGLGANAFDARAVDKIFAAKGRPGDNPLIVHVCKKSQIEEVACEISADARKIIDKLWPDSLTIVLKKRDSLPPNVTAGLDTVAVRMPASREARGFIRACGVPLAAPSANKSGRPSPTSVLQVAEDMDGRAARHFVGQKLSRRDRVDGFGFDGRSACRSASRHSFRRVDRKGIV